MNETAGARHTRAEALLLLVVAIWAANYPVAKYGISGLNIFVFNSLRFVIATLVIGAVFLARSAWVRVAASDWRRLIRAGLVANVIYQIAFIIGLNMTTAGNSALILSTSPLWTIVIYARLRNEKIARNVLAGMIISLGGIAMIIVGSGKEVGFGIESLAGDCVCLTGAVLWAFNTNLQSPLLVRYSALQLSLVMVSVGAVGLTAIAVPAATSVPWSSVHWSYYLAAAASGAFSIGVGNIIWSFGVKILGPGRTGNFNNLVPILAFVLSSVWLGEQVSLVQCIGAAITVLGVWYARR